MALFSSSTRQVPTAAAVPRHVAVIMDGNGRWAKKRLMPRFSGHIKGVGIVRKMVRACLERGIEYLTLFAFSSENWRRPPEEVSLLMQLFIKALEQEVDKLDRNGVRLRIIGDLSRFDKGLQELIVAAEARTAGNRLPTTPTMTAKINPSATSRGVMVNSKTISLNVSKLIVAAFCPLK